MFMLSKCAILSVYLTNYKQKMTPTEVWYFNDSFRDDCWTETLPLGHRPGLEIRDDLSSYFMDAEEAEGCYPGIMTIFEQLWSAGCNAENVTALLKYCLDQTSSQLLVSILDQPSFMEIVRLAVGLDLDGATTVATLNHKLQAATTVSLPNLI